MIAPGRRCDTVQRRRSPQETPSARVAEGTSRVRPTANRLVPLRLLEPGKAGQGLEPA